MTRNITTAAERRWLGPTVMATAAMGLGTFLPFALGVLGPFIVRDLGLPRSALGILVTATFVTATLLSLGAGGVVDVLGGRRLLAALLVFLAAQFAVVSAVPSYVWLAVVAAASGLSQAAVNPVTNKLVAAHVPEERRGIAMGIKQSGVQIGAFLAGLVLPAAAVAFGWRGALRLIAVLPLVILAVGLRTVPADPAADDTGRRRPLRFPTGVVAWLMAYAFFMGGGVAATTTYLPLYAHEELGMAETTAGLVLSVLGLTAVFARILWSDLSSRTRAMAITLAALAAGGMVCALLLWQASTGGAWLLWVGAIGLGASASSWNSVGNLAVVSHSALAETGHASAMVAVGFFAGFVASPPVFGGSVDAIGAYDVGWFLVAAQFAAAAAIAMMWWRRGLRR